MIAWKYLNKPSATVAALQDYATMRDIINITPQETKELYDRMISTGGRQLTGLPTSWNPQANENRLVKCLDTLDVIQERYRQAVEYMCAHPECQEPDPVFDRWCDRVCAAYQAGLAAFQA